MKVADKMRSSLEKLDSNLKPRGTASKWP